MTKTIALDRKTVRTVDIDGRLHIARSHMSKSDVNPYYGREIPGAANLGLDLNKIYWLYRDPDELAKAAPTFNNLPILDVHVPVTADEPQQEIVIGSTGTDAEFNDGYLDNSAVIWVQSAIDDVEAEKRKEWSCAYHYVADMTPGEINGLRFDGIMRNIVGNHVALVKEGRAGSDVMVADAMPENRIMKLNTRTALAVNGGLVALVTPLLAQDAKVNLATIVDGLTEKNVKSRAADIAAKVVAAVTPKLAADEGLEVSDVVAVIEAVQGSPGAATVEDDDLMADPDPGKMTLDGDDAMSKVMAALKGMLSDEDMAKIAAIAGGQTTMDADPDDDDADPERKPPAMDAVAIRRAATREMQAIRTAEREVEPHIGEVQAMDSASAVYRLALDAAGIDVTGVHPSAYGAMVRMLPVPGEAKPVRIAADSSSIARLNRILEGK